MLRQAIWVWRRRRTSEDKGEIKEKKREGEGEECGSELKDKREDKRG